MPCRLQVVSHQNRRAVAFYAAGYRALAAARGAVVWAASERVACGGRVSAVAAIADAGHLYSYKSVPG